MVGFASNKSVLNDFASMSIIGADDFGVTCSGGYRAKAMCKSIGCCCRKRGHESRQVNPL